MVQGSQKPGFNRVVLETAAGLKHHYHSPFLQTSQSLMLVTARSTCAEQEIK